MGAGAVGSRCRASRDVDGDVEECRQASMLRAKGKVGYSVVVRGFVVAVPKSNRPALVPSLSLSCPVLSWPGPSRYATPLKQRQARAPFPTHRQLKMGPIGSAQRGGRHLLVCSFSSAPLLLYQRQLFDCRLPHDCTIHGHRMVNYDVHSAFILQIVSLSNVFPHRAAGGLACRQALTMDSATFPRRRCPRPLSTHI